MNEGQIFVAGFEEDDRLRSAFIRRLILRQANLSGSSVVGDTAGARTVPRTLVRYWHDLNELPGDVRACLGSWAPLKDHGFDVRTFDDASAAEYIGRRYTGRESEAFRRCRHPAMRSDYLRMCFILAEGGIYVDADDVLVGQGLEEFLVDGSLKLQPFCYDISANAMAPSEDIWRPSLPRGDRIFYVNNNPLAAASGHPILRRALARATAKLLSGESRLEIQSTTGPGNLTAALAAHAHELEVNCRASDFCFIRDWNAIAETRWELSYRHDDRNWRNMNMS